MFSKTKNRFKNLRIFPKSLKNAQKILRYLKPYKFQFCTAWFFLLLTTLASLLLPLFLGKLIGRSPSSFNFNEQNLSETSTLNSVEFISMLIFILFIFHAIFSFFKILMFTRISESTIMDIKNDLFNKLVHLPISFFNNQKMNNLSARIDADIINVHDCLQSIFSNFLRQIIITLGGVGLLFYFSWKLAILMLFTLPIVVLMAKYFAKHIRILTAKSQTKIANASALSTESLQRIKDVKSFTNELYIQDLYYQKLNEINQLNNKIGLLKALFSSFVIVFVFGAIYSFIWIGIKLMYSEWSIFDPEKFFSFIFCTIRIGASIGKIPDLFSSILKSIESADNIMSIIELKDEKDILCGTKKPEVNGIVSFKNVQFSFPSRENTPVLSDINFESSSNQKIAIVGASGAGKSTLIALLLRFYNVKIGKILINSTPLNEIDLQYLRSKIAYVPQEVFLMSRTIEENIKFGNPNASFEEIEIAAKLANALEFIEKCPEGFNTMVGEGGISLSVGERQRIAIARAFLKKPAILILDEATSSLDSETEMLVQKGIDLLLLNRTSFIIAHRLSTVLNADKIIVLEKGRLVEQGTHEQLINIKNGRYSRLVTLQNLG